MVKSVTGNLASYYINPKFIFFKELESSILLLLLVSFFTYIESKKLECQKKRQMREGFVFLFVLRKSVSLYVYQDCFPNWSHQGRVSSQEPQEL